MQGRTSRRRRRKRSSGLNLLLAVNKPFGQITREVDNHVANLLEDDGVGHLGTLDPAVTGVLVLGVGRAKKLFPLMEVGRTKTYAATITFGTETDTDDAQGSVIRTAELGPELRDPAFARDTIQGLVGRFDQVPPRYSAVKVNGVRAYDRARAGEDFELEPREVEVFSADFFGIEEDGELGWNCVFTVSPGTYVRALARDVGRAVNSAAHLGSLCRVSAGNVGLKDCVSMEQLEEAGLEGVHGLALDPVRALGFPTYPLSSQELSFARNGRSFEARHQRDYAQGERVSLVFENLLMGVWRHENGRLRPEVNCPEGVEGVRA